MLNEAQTWLPQCAAPLPPPHLAFLVLPSVQPMPPSSHYLRNRVRAWVLPMSRPAWGRVGGKRKGRREAATGHRSGWSCVEAAKQPEGHT
eukprot:84038-Chlamydomonas_euryale.AAC.3